MEDKFAHSAKLKNKYLNWSCFHLSSNNRLLKCSKWTWSDIEFLVFIVRCKKLQWPASSHASLIADWSKGMSKTLEFFSVFFWVLQSLNNQSYFSSLKQWYKRQKRSRKKCVKNTHLASFEVSWLFCWLNTNVDFTKCFVWEKEIKISITLNTYCLLQISSKI